MLEPIFEADLPPEQYANRPGRNAQQAVVEVEALLFRGHPEVVDADLADYFGSIPHAELLKSVARRIVDRRVLHLIKLSPTIDCIIPRSRHDPKILWVDDAEIVGDRITKVRPIPRNLFTQKTERRIGELGASCVALVVSDVSVHEAP